MPAVPAPQHGMIDKEMCLSKNWHDVSRLGGEVWAAVRASDADLGSDSSLLTSSVVHIFCEEIAGAVTGSSRRGSDVARAV